MDAKYLTKIAELVDILVGDGCPTDEELDYDDDYINLYQTLDNLKSCFEDIGYL